jgi:hypothetical protein
VEIINGFRRKFITAVGVAVDPSTPHGTFLDSCPNQHCQTSTGWNSVRVNGTTMAEAAAAWYFNGTVQKHVDAPFPSNPSCGFKQDGDRAPVVPICSNCANAGLGSNCLWDEMAGSFHGL